MGRYPDHITLVGVEAHGHHGVYPEERERGQLFVIDVDLAMDLAVPALTDEVADTVHYGELADRIVAAVQGEPVNLIEALASRIVGVCLADTRVEQVVVTVHKPQAPLGQRCRDVSVTLCRTRCDVGGGANDDARGAVPGKQPG